MKTKMKFLQALSIFILIFSCQVPAWRFVNNVNFTDCFESIVAKTKQDCRDTETQICIFDPVTKFWENEGQVYLSEPGCERLCGDGYGYWEIQDTLLRLVMWVIPTAILLAHFHFAPLGFLNALYSILHILGDPIDSMWSMLTRQEVSRRHYQRARTTLTGTSTAALAAIWCAYDELGFTDPSDHFFDALREREGRTTRGGANYPQPSVGRSSTLPGSTGWLAFVRRSTGFGLGGSPSSHPRRRTDERVHPDAVENYLIEVAAQSLQSSREESQGVILASILGLIGALAGAFIRTWKERRNNQTAHTIAVVCLLFNFIPIVQISSQIGGFTSPTAAVYIIQNLRRNLEIYYNRLGHRDRMIPFPPLEFRDDILWDGRFPDQELREGSRSSDLNTDNLAIWPGVAGFSGMNACWRPRKNLSRADQFSNYQISHTWLGFWSFSIITVGSYVPALVLSYRTPLKGFGCRSLSWTVILALWYLSVVCDFGLKSLKKGKMLEKARHLWLATVVKDSVVSIAIAAIIVSAQIGLLNSCWCRSGALTNAKVNYVNLNPFTENQWRDGWILWLATPIASLILIAAFIFTVGGTWKEARVLLNRDLRARAEDIIRINNMRRDLPAEYRNIFWDSPWPSQTSTNISRGNTSRQLGREDEGAMSTSRHDGHGSREPLMRTPYDSSIPNGSGLNISQAD
jgi:uncharacterized membrane protein YeaQ/YmgE (transglycosylase-associated protein family)